MKSKTIECACSSAEHAIKLVRYEDEPNEIFLFTFLSERTFIKRLILGIRYIFGYKCRYGHFEETILNDEGIKKLKDFLDGQK